MNRRTWTTAAWNVLDLAAALFLFVTVNGVRFGSTDDSAFVPWVFRMEDPALYPADIRFQTAPHAYYAFYLGYLYALARVIPIEWALVASNLAWTLCLLVALQRLARRISGTRIPAMLLALLIAGYQNSHLVGGYHLTSPSFSSHYAAIALSLLAMTFHLDGHHRRTAGTLLAAALFNVRLGAFAAAGVLLLWFRRAGRDARRIAAGLGACAGLATLVWILWPRHGPAPALSAGDIAHLEMYVRSPGHTLPFSWEPFVFVNLALAALHVACRWSCTSEPAGRDLCACALLGLGGIGLGLFNNTTLRIPHVVVANLFELGPFVLACLYVSLAAALMERVRRGQFLSSLLVLALPDLQTRLVLLLAASLLDHRLSGLWPESPWRRDVLSVGVLAAVAAVHHALLPPAYRQLPYDAAVLRWRAWLLGATLPPVLLLAATRRLGARSLAALTVAGTLFVAWKMETRDDIRINYDVTRDWRETCDFARLHTPPAACFVTSPGWETASFQYLSRRSSYANFTLVPLNPDRIGEWMQRLQDLRYLPRGLRLNEVNAPLRCDEQAYDTMTLQDFLRIREQNAFVEYAVVRRLTNLPLTVLFENASYRIYRLHPAAE